jgi:GH25 family lysozyme M1 (1,4-beta-N-acetylmuramidase)
LKKREDEIPWAHGPDGKDFHVGLEPCRPSPKSTLHGGRRNRVKVIAAEKVALRYAPDSTAFYYLQRGDGVRELYRRLQNDYAAVSVTSSKTTPGATRGWIDIRALAGEKVTGVDVSSFSGDIDFQALRGSGEEYVIIKATESTEDIDKTFFSNVEDARKAYLYVGASHVLRPRPGRSGTQEAEDFIRAMKLAKIGSTDIRPVIKITTSRLDRDDTEKYVGEFVGALRLAGYDALLYTYPKFLNWTKAFNADLYIASYGVSKPSIPEPWDDYALWQYTQGDVPGIKGKVSRSRCPDLARIVQR